MSSNSVSVAWEVIFTTFGQAEECFVRWTEQGRLQAGQKVECLSLLHGRLRELRNLAEQGGEPPVLPGMLPLQAEEVPLVGEFRLWWFLSEEILNHQAAGRLTLAQAHALAEECYERISLLKRRIAQSGIKIKVRLHTPKAQADPPAVAAAPPAANPSRRGILEILLDPRSIQWLMGLGGALMAVGIVILLWINEFFTPPVLAVSMGLVNLAVLAGGGAVILKTRYHLVGKGLTLLACLLMPLNLWYYHIQHLMTLDGHLWVAAVAISALYAAAAWTLKDEMFVYVLNAGLAMTGLLFIAKLPPSPQKFWEIASPATLLVALGLLAIHAERAFGQDEGPFGQKRFGRAFFVSGHALLVAGLALIFGAQLAGDWLYQDWLRPFYQSWGVSPSPICGELRWLGLTLVLAGTYAYLYSALVVRSHGFHFHAAAFTLLWAEVLTVQLLNFNLGLDAIIIVLAVTSLVVNLVQASLAQGRAPLPAFPLFGLLLGLLPVLLGVYEYYRYLGLQSVWIGQEPRWSYVGAMAFTAVVSRIGAYLYRGATPWLPMAYYFATAAATMVAAVAALAALGLKTWYAHAPILMLLPIAYLVAARLYGESAPAASLRSVAHAATWVMLASSLASAFTGFTDIVAGQALNLGLAAFFAEAAVFYGLVCAFERKPKYVHWATLMACGALWQMMTYAGFSANVYLLTFATIGLLLLFAYRFSVLEQTAAAPLAGAAFKAANSLLSLSFLSSVFRGLSRLTGEPLSLDWSFVGFSVLMSLAALLAVASVQVAAWRRWYMVNVVAQAALTLLAAHKLIDLNFWQQVELFSVGMGMLLLALGHLGWYREQERESDLVSMNLFFGSVLAALPLAIATWIDRGHGQFHIVNEAGFLFVSVALLVSGVLFQLKWTAILGGGSTALYFLTLLIFIPWGRLSTVATLITVGGCLLFGLGLGLAFFREHLLVLPARIQKREGFFKVLNWR